MGRLTKSEKDFLRYHDIPLSSTFDITGMSVRDYKKEMKAKGKLIGYGANPCQNAGHTLKTRSGHCPQCRTETIGYLKRHISDGDIYVAFSRSANLTKIGYSTCTPERISSLNKTQYGGCDDWEATFSMSLQSAGEVESAAQKIIEEYSVQGIYYWNGSVLRECSELFSCDYSIAIEAIEFVVQDRLEAA